MRCSFVEYGNQFRKIPQVVIHFESLAPYGVGRKKSNDRGVARAPRYCLLVVRAGDFVPAILFPSGAKTFALGCNREAGGRALDGVTDPVPVEVNRGTDSAKETRGADTRERAFEFKVHAQEDRSKTDAKENETACGEKSADEKWKPFP